MEYKYKSIGNPVEIQWNANSNQVKIAMIFQLKFQWNTNGNPFEIQLKFNRNFNEIPMKINWKPVEISIIQIAISMKYQWKSIVNPVIIQ